MGNAAALPRQATGTRRTYYLPCLGAAEPVALQPCRYSAHPWYHAPQQRLRAAHGQTHPQETISGLGAHLEIQISPAWRRKWILLNIHITFLSWELAWILEVAGAIASVTLKFFLRCNCRMCAKMGSKMPVTSDIPTGHASTLISKDISCAYAWSYWLLSLK